MDISERKMEDPKAVLSLLKVIQSKPVELSSIENVKAEKVLRELASFNFSLYLKNKKDYENVQKVAKDILR